MVSQSHPLALPSQFVALCVSICVASENGEDSKQKETPRCPLDWLQRLSCWPGPPSLLSTPTLCSGWKYRADTACTPGLVWIWPYQWLALMVLSPVKHQPLALLTAV